MQFILEAKISKISAADIADKFSRALDKPEMLWEEISEMNEEEKRDILSHYITDPLARNRFLKHLKNVFCKEMQDKKVENEIQAMELKNQEEKRFESLTLTDQSTEQTALTENTSKRRSKLSNAVDVNVNFNFISPPLQ